ncbi:WD repeat-containing protein 89 [Chanos chanos]|uniref:WD repeat-containing protein 89 n=1 Tax=Chanos chanos TaxID=29144 RepID=A0A6J2V7J6_CHACN|nr:WD repeat-containing protein 89 [Chanos chanos]XP_030627758.1 WD repeat-containing protein 89 [Chanos chanos]
METLEDTFKALSIARRLQHDDPTYILDLAFPANSQAEVVAVCCSDRSVRLYTANTLCLQREYQGHTGALCGVRFAHNSSDLLFSGSADGTLRCWDVRQPCSEAVQVFQSDPAHSYCSFDASCSDTVLCAGTEKVNEDSFLVFWDARMVRNGEESLKKDGLLGVYSESHSDDITSVCFHPRQADRLATGATDGLVNVFDLSQGSEDDALFTTCNSDSSVSSICWAGKDLQQLLCLSHDEGLHLWDVGQLDSTDPLTLLSANDARTLAALPEGKSLDYFIGGTWLEDGGHLLVAGGTNDGELHLLDCSGSGLRLIRSLVGGHSATVRCSHWSPVRSTLFTGGEDGLLLQWRPDAEDAGEGKRDMLKTISAMQLKSRSYRHHPTKREKKQQA